MGLSLSVKGEIAFELTNYEIRAYEFTYAVANSKYAKSHEDQRTLKITGDISRIIEKNAHILELIRQWSKIEYESPEYYNWVKITETYADEIIREITFPDAFIKEYWEEINPHTGHGTFTLLLMQKMDKRIDIIIDPFNEKFPSLSELMNPESPFNKIAAAAGLSAAMAAAILMNPELYPHAGIADLLNGTSEFSKDPVNLATGNFVYAWPDIKIGGAFPLALNRFYNSVDDYKGAFGFNWHHSYEIKLNHLDGGAKEIIFEDGHRETYTPDETGSYKGAEGVYKKLRANEDGYTLKLPDGKKYGFNEIGQINYIEDINSNQTVFTYKDEHLDSVSTQSGSIHFTYSDGFIDAITDHTGRKVFYNYADGNVSRFTDVDGRSLQYEYSPVTNRLSAITNPLGHRILYNDFDSSAKTTVQAFPDGGRMDYAYLLDERATELIERNGNKIIYYYDENYRIYKEEHDDGAIEKIFDSQNNMTAYTDKAGNTWKYEYNENGKRVKEIDPLGNETVYRYGLANKLTRTIKANGAETTNKYDAKGNLIGLVDALGNEVKIQYNEQGLPVSLVNFRGFQLSSDYDDGGNRVGERDALGNLTVYEYDELNRPSKIILPEGNTRAFQYNARGKVKQLIDGNGNMMEYGYDSADNIIEIKDFNGNKTYYKYNEMNRPIKKTDAMGNVCLYEYDHMWNVVRETDELGNDKIYQYDGLNRLVGVIDEAGNQTTFDYDKNGNMVKETDALGQDVGYRYDALNRRTVTISKANFQSTIVYDAVGNIIKTTDYMGNETNFEYDLNNKLLKVVNPLGGETSYTYDEAGNTVAVENPLGDTTRYEYNGKDKVSAMITPLGGRSEIIYDKNGNVKEIVNPEGYKTSYEYDKNDRLISLTNPEGHTFRYEYDLNGNRTAVIDGRGNRKTFGYDPLNQITSMTDESGGMSFIKYDPKGRVASFTNAEGAITLNTYDKKGNITKVTNALGGETFFEYDGLNRMTKRIEANGAETSFAYNALGMVKSVTNNDGVTACYEYDRNGNMTKAINGVGETYTYEYDALGQVTKVTNPLGHSDIFLYDTMSRITSVTDRNGHTTQYRYDAMGNVKETIDALGHSAYFEYDGMNRLVKMRLNRQEGSDMPGEEQVTLYQYDGRGLVTKVINNEGGEKLFIYDENGNLLQKTDEDGYITAYSYNPKNLVKLINYSDDKKVYFEYNKAGKLVEVADWTGKTSFELDELNKILRVNDHNGKEVSYAYDIMGNQREIQYAGGEKVSYSYDLMGRLIEMAGEGQVMKHLYDPLGRLKERKRENGLIERYEYDGLGQLTKVLEAPGEGETAVVMNKYGYDPQGNVVHEFKRDIEGGAHQSISYGYDEVNRLTQAIEGHGYFERSYEYDSLGNLSLEIRDGETTKYSVDGLNRLVRKETGGKEGYSYAYDQRGNLVQETDEMNKKIIGSYEYDETNRMVRGRNESGGERTYRYNGLGVLVGQTGAGKKDYVMDYTAYVLRPLIETGEGGITNSYAYDGRNRVWAEMDSNGEKVKLQYHNDRLGSTVKVTDSAGKIQAMANYDEWGSRTKVKVAQVGGMALDLAASYTGHDWDEALGMYHAKARMYDPGNKRFTAADTHWNVSNMIYGDKLNSVKGFVLPDSMAIRQSINRYSYCINSPLNFIDSIGFEAIVVSGGAYSDPNHAGYKYNFIETAIKQITDIRTQEINAAAPNKNKVWEKVAWVITDEGWTQDDWDTFQDVADRMLVDIVKINNTDELVNYLNTKNTDDSDLDGISASRQIDKVSSFTVFSHGLAENNGIVSLGFNYSADYNKDLDFYEQQIYDINPDAFNEAVSIFYSCNTATAGDSSFAAQWHNHLGGNVKAYAGRTDYSKIMYPDNYNPVTHAFEAMQIKSLRKNHGFSTSGSYYLPKGDPGVNTIYYGDW